MTSYFRLVDDVSIPNRWHLGDVTDDAEGAATLLAGVAIAAPRRLRIAVSQPGKELEFCLTSFAVPVASTRLAKAVSAIADEDLQLISLELDHRNDFVVMNSTRTVDCFDELRSSYRKWSAMDHRPDLEGCYKMVTTLFIDPKRVPSDAHFFRIQRWPVGLIVSQVVRIAMERAGCLGAKFLPVT